MRNGKADCFTILKRSTKLTCVNSEFCSSAFSQMGFLKWVHSPNRTFHYPPERPVTRSRLARSRSTVLTSQRAHQNTLLRFLVDEKSRTSGQGMSIMVEHRKWHSSCMSSHTQELPAGTFAALIIGLFVGHPPMMRGMAPCSS